MAFPSFNGNTLITPQVSSAIDDSGLDGQGVNTGNRVAIIGTSESGQPNVAHRFRNPTQAIRVLRSGLLLEAVKKAFDPSPEGFAPSEVTAVRINPALRSSLTLNGVGAIPVINLVSTDYGALTNQISIKVESGTLKGKRVTTAFRGRVHTANNLHGEPFDITYTGTALTATITIGADGHILLAAPAGSVVADIDTAIFRSYGDVVDRINATPDFAATLLARETASSAGTLDYVTAVSVKSIVYTVRADLQAVINWLNSSRETNVTATRVAGAGLTPLNIPTTYLTSGTSGSVTTQQWADALEGLQREDVGFIAVLSPLPAIHAMLDAHCTYMSGVGKSERRGFVGGDVGVGSAGSIALALPLNSDRTAVCFPGYIEFDDQKRLTTYASYMTAAAIAACFAGLPAGEAMTNKGIKARGMETRLRDVIDTDALVEGGVLCVKTEPRGFIVAKSCTTWRQNDNFNRIEISTGVALDETARQLRDVMQPFIGKGGAPELLLDVAAQVESRLRLLSTPKPIGPGLLVGDEANPPYRGISLTLVGDQIRLSVEVSPVIPVNYGLITIHASAFAGELAI